MTLRAVVPTAGARGFYNRPSMGSVQRAPLATGDAGMQQLLNAIMASAIAGAKNPEMWQLARTIVRNVPSTDARGRVKALFNYFADDDRVPYVLDPVDVQIIPSVEAALRQNGVDCKGKTILLISAIRSIGYEARPATINQGTPGGLSKHGHIYAEWRPNAQSKWEPADTVLRETDREATLGHEATYSEKLSWESPDE